MNMLTSGQFNKAIFWSVVMTLIISLAILGGIYYGMAGMDRTSTADVVCCGGMVGVCELGVPQVGPTPTPTPAAPVCTGSTDAPSSSPAPTDVVGPTPRSRPTDGVRPTNTDAPPTPTPAVPEPNPTPEPSKLPTATPTIEPSAEPRCNKGKGNGGEGCDPGNNPDKGNDDED